MPSCTCKRASAMSFDPAGSPPATSTRHCASSACASSIARRLSSSAALRPAASAAGNMPPRHKPVTVNPCARIARAAASTPIACSRSRHGAMPRIPCRAQPSIACAKPQRLRVVAVLSDRSAGSGDVVTAEHNQNIDHGDWRTRRKQNPCVISLLLSPCSPCLRGSKIFALESRHIQPPPLPPAALRELGELNAARALEQIPSEVTLARDVLQEQLPLRFECIVPRQIVRNFLPARVEIDRLRNVWIPYRLRRIRARLCEAAPKSRDSGAM